MTGKRNIAILGATGSIGTQALEVISSHPEHFNIDVLTASENADLLIEQSIKYKPKVVVIADDRQYGKVNSALSSRGVTVLSGWKQINEAVALDSTDIVLTAVVGYAGLMPTLAAINAGKDIALANKETLVVAGDLVTALARKNKINIYPVDSEHSAIYQCLAGEEQQAIEKIILTASGGPFRGKNRGFLKTIGKKEALKHPNWEMGNKITIDSATLMNKGLEVIEAKWLFGLERDQIEVVVHPQSIIHSFVQFKDGSIKAQLGLPDMKLPILYALSYPQRLATSFPRFNFANYPTLTFEQPDLETFKNLALAYESLDRGGNMPCVLNAANEVVVDAFLKDKIGFLEMADVVETCLMKMPYIQTPQYEDYVESDNETRIKANELIS